MFGVFYFLMIRPQQKKMKKQNEMLSALTSGDEVVLSSGIIGKVAGLTDKVVTLEVAKDVKVKVLKSQVSQVVKGQVQELA
jgi:preprotein translocase subunit YajC